MASTHTPTVAQLRTIGSLCKTLAVTYTHPPTTQHAVIAIVDLLDYRDALDEHPVLARMSDVRLDFTSRHPLCGS
jgi:hypothetical protein